jgi:hypothetical protein
MTKYNWIDRFYVSPIASILFFSSLALGIFISKLFWIASLFSLLWIYFRWIDFEQKYL